MKRTIEENAIRVAERKRLYGIYQTYRKTHETVDAAALMVSALQDEIIDDLIKEASD